jgi:hypothetical protein
VSTYFGPENTGDAADNGNANSCWATRDEGYECICPGSGVQNIDSIEVYVKGTAGNVRCAIYGLDNVLICQWGEEKAVGANYAWIPQDTLSGTTTLTGGVHYELACSYDNAAVTRPLGADTGGCQRTGSDYTGGFPTPISYAGTYNYVFPIRCGVTAAASSHPTIKRFGGVPYASLNKGVW